MEVKLILFRLEIFALEGGIFRFKINEAYPIRERVEVPYALVEDIPTQNKLEVVTKDDVSLTIIIMFIAWLLS